MVRDPRTGLQDNVDVYLEHLQQVVEDASNRDWPSVRCWSQATFDAVERGAASWEDRQAIQVDRVHHAVMAVRTQPNSHPQPVDRRDIPCRDFNSHSGCHNQKSHPGRTVNFIHVCSMCFQAGDRHPHPSHSCPRRQSQQHQVAAGRHQPPSTQPAQKNLQPASHHASRMMRPVLGDFTTYTRDAQLTPASPPPREASQRITTLTSRHQPPWRMVHRPPRW